MFFSFQFWSESTEFLWFNNWRCNKKNQTHRAFFSGTNRIRFCFCRLHSCFHVCCCFLLCCDVLTDRRTEASPVRPGSNLPPLMSTLVSSFHIVSAGFFSSSCLSGFHYRSSPRLDRTSEVLCTSEQDRKWMKWASTLKMEPRSSALLKL